MQTFLHISDYYKVSHRLVVGIPFLKQIGGSALIDESLPVPEGNIINPYVPVTVVPFRNGNLLFFAAA